MPEESEEHLISRRTLLAGGAGIVGAGVLTACGTSSSKNPAKKPSAAASTKAAGSDLGAVEHVVFLMQENRSFDHYFGTYPGVRGFDDRPKSGFGNFAADLAGRTERHAAAVQPCLGHGPTLLGQLEHSHP